MLVLAALLACVTPPSSTPDSEEPTQPPDGPWIEADCVESADNVLRYDCVVTVEPPGPVEIAFRDTRGGPERTHRSEEVASEHAIRLFLMAPLRSYTYTARALDDAALQDTGAFQTGALPAGAQAQLAVTGTASFPYALVLTHCKPDPHVLIVDTTGEVLWYQGFDGKSYPPRSHAASFTEDQTVLVIAGGDVIEVDLAGDTVLHLRAEEDLPHEVHHDVFRRDGRTWVLFHERVTWMGKHYLLDGVYVFDAAGERIATWRLFDHFQPSMPPSSNGDYSHANSVWVDEDGDFYVSMRHLNAVAKMDGRLASPDFGSILWRLTGSAEPHDFDSDFFFYDGVPGVDTFQHQHNAHVLPDGRLVLFDNRRVPEEASRVLVFELDESKWIAQIDEQYDLPLHCHFQGSAWTTTEGAPVGHCAPSATAYEFGDGPHTIATWTMRATCDQGPSMFVPRTVPIESL